MNKITSLKTGRMFKDVKNIRNLKNEIEIDFLNYFLYIFKNKQQFFQRFLLKGTFKEQFKKNMKQDKELCSNSQTNLINNLIAIFI